MEFNIKSVLNLQHQQAVREWMDISDWNIPVFITLTLKQSISTAIGQSAVRVRLNKYIASQNFRHFMSILNKKIYGNASRRYGKKLSVYAVLEGGLKNRRFSVDKNMHYHAVINCPDHVNINKFENLIRTSWLESQWGDLQIDIQFYADAGAVDYITKTKDKYSVSDGIDWMNVHKK